MGGLASLRYARRRAAREPVPEWEEEWDDEDLTPVPVPAESRR